MSRLILFIALLFSTPAHAQLPCWPCDTWIWVLTLNGYTIEGLGDMTEEECENARLNFDDQTEAFANLKCESVAADREEF